MNMTQIYQKMKDSPRKNTLDHRFLNIVENTVNIDSPEK